MNEIIDKIKSRGYWRINFEPLKVGEPKLRLADCAEVVRRNSIKLRGWYYPHVPDMKRNNQDIGPGENFYEAWVDWGNHIEFWRMYQSGQFIHYLALREDWLKEDDWANEKMKQIKPMTILGIISSVIWEFTEIFLFLSRLAESGIYDDGVRVSLTLMNTKGRTLSIEQDFFRAPFLQEYSTSADKIHFEKEYSKKEVLEDPKQLALDAMLYVVDRFGWHNPPVNSLKQDQENLIKRQF